MLELGLLMAGVVLVGGCGSSKKDSAKEAKIRLYIHDTLTKLATDGYQSLILFYRTSEWAEPFNRAFAPDFQVSE